MEEQNKTDLVEFYRERLLPLAELVRSRGMEFFPLGPETDKQSYFIDRTDEGDYIHTINARDLGAELEKMWADNRLPELVKLARPLADLAASLHQNEEAPDEVSPFIYAMF